MKEAKTYKLTTGDTLTDVKTIKGNILTCIIGKVHVPELKRPISITVDPTDNNVIVHNGWKLVDAAGEARLNAIMDALKTFFDNFAPVRAH